MKTEFLFILFSILAVTCFSENDKGEFVVNQDTPFDSDTDSHIETAYKCKTDYTVPIPKCRLEYLETFQGDSKESGKWVYSYQREFSGQSWIWGFGFEKPTIDCDKSLITEYPSTRYGIATLLEKPINNRDKDLIVQYEVRFQKGLTCGGAYIKLLRDGSIRSAEDLKSTTPYVLMFGPDYCGEQNRIHVIIPHYNPIDGQWTEKKLVRGPLMIVDKLTHLYTLIIRRDNSLEILVDQINKFTGSLLTDFEPPFSSPTTIADPEDKKPDDWIDQERIYDPTDVKPEDWDETEPKFIIDEAAVKPSDWLDDEPLTIADPEAVPPDDWDEEAYGVFEGALIRNPRCDEVSGCGIWEKPSILNPLFKGPYPYRTIRNPLYKGPWFPHFISNPSAYEEKEPHNLSAIGGIAIEIWTMQEGIAFDNILITHDEACAEAFADGTFRVKRQRELQQHPEVARRETIPVAEDVDVKEEEEEEKWVKKRRAGVSLGVFVNNLIDDFFHWDYDEQRCDRVQKGLIGVIGIIAVLCFVIYFRNREFIHKAKLF